MLLALLGAAPAQASFHLIKVREVFPGTTARPDSGYVELQMYASGQSLVQFGELEVLNSTGTVTNSFKPSSSVANFANQSTVLIADTEFASQFPGKSADFTDEGLNLNPGGGAVCWPQTEPPFDDCASWGNFTGQASLPSPGDSSPAAAIPNGMALLRSIDPGCPTFLEDADDSNDSAVDFSAHAPNPRSNSTAPTESECAAPAAAIDSKPKSVTNATTATFTYHSEPAGAAFECKLDLGAFTSCLASGTEYTGLAPGGHTFQVRAKDVNGTGQPASYSWTVDTTPPTATIKTHPASTSPGASAAFTYQSNELNSTFECRLSPTETNFTGCEKSGKTYAGLANGGYSFEVRAIDPAGNVQAIPTAFSWTVDNSLKDETPPETTILSRPPDPSGSPTASFTYASNEPGSTFECRLDGAGFALCPVEGITYSGLGNGSHAFQVRAVDSSGNPDLSPARYSFEVVLTSTVMLPAPSAPQPSRAPPETTLFGKPPARTRDRSPTFRFRSARGASFQCKIDSGPFKPCGSPFTTKGLGYGPHMFQVRAVTAGRADPSPAKFRFRVVR